MENKVGDTFPATSEVNKLIKEVNALNATLRKFCINLSPEERQSLTRGRRGAEEHLRTVASLAKQYSVTVPGATPDSLLNDLRTDAELAALEQSLLTALDLVRDTRSQARSESHEAGYMFYAILQGAGERIPEIKAQLKPFAEFLSPARRKKPQPPQDPT